MARVAQRQASTAVMLWASQLTRTGLSAAMGGLPLIQTHHGRALVLEDGFV